MGFNKQNHINHITNDDTDPIIESGTYWFYESTKTLVWQLIYTQFKIKSKPVNSRFAAELETVLFGLGRTENQINLQGLLWKQSSKTIIRLDLNKLQYEDRQTTQITWLFNLQLLPNILKDLHEIKP